MRDLHLEDTGIAPCNNQMRHLAALTVCDHVDTKELAAEWLLTLGLAERVGDNRLYPLGEDDGVRWSPKDRSARLAGFAAVRSRLS